MREDCKMPNINKGLILEGQFIENKLIGKYRIIKNLGCGSSSKVILALNTETREKVAIKIVQRKGSDAFDEYSKSDIRIFREAIISSLAKHPHIVRLMDFMYTNNTFFLVFEYVKGRQLYDLIVNNGAFKEAVARRYYRQLLSAVDYIHRNSIVHRDLKIENILIDENDNLKLIDFGLSNFYDNKMLLNTFCGSLYFAAPELLLGNRYCGPEIDVWSLGVILYVLLCGAVPFDDDNVNNLQEKIKTAEFVFQKAISEEAVKLIKGMIIPEPAGRMCLEQIFNSEWVNLGYKTAVNNYMIKRYPITSLHLRYLNILKEAINFQFPNLEREIRRFCDLSIQDNGSLEQLYWAKRPVVSLYYLFLENFNFEFSDMQNKEKTLDISNETFSTSEKVNIPETIHNFVNFLYSRDEGIYMSKPFKPNVFQNPLPSSTELNFKPGTLPLIRTTYVKGFFKGIKVKNIGSHNALKKILLDVFLNNNVVYEANEKSFYCSFYSDEDECYFKVSMYYNVLLSEYYLIVTWLTGEKKVFKEIYNIINKVVTKQLSPVKQEENMQQ